MNSTAQYETADIDSLIQTLESRLSVIESRLLMSKSPVSKQPLMPVPVDVSSSTNETHWQRTLNELVIPAVVAIKFSTVRCFDSAKQSCSVATGFVVDQERGLILTNRHVTKPGPVTAEAIWND
jgi:S1-C subfamily serine protease